MPISFPQENQQLRTEQEEKTSALNLKGFEIFDTFIRFYIRLPTNGYFEACLVQAGVTELASVESPSGLPHTLTDEDYVLLLWSN